MFLLNQVLRPAKYTSGTRPNVGLHDLGPSLRISSMDFRSALRLALLLPALAFRHDREGQERISGVSEFGTTPRRGVCKFAEDGSPFDCISVGKVFLSLLGPPWSSMVLVSSQSGHRATKCVA